MPTVQPMSITFAGGTLDRAAELRADGLERGGQMVLVGPGQTVEPDGGHGLVRHPPDRSLELVLLGLHDGEPVFAADAPAGPSVSLRTAAAALPAAEAALAAYAVSLIEWTRTHRHCGRCGTPTESQHSGHRRHCPACGLNAFPRTDPVATMLIESGPRALLTRRRGAAGVIWSALAGFIEPGETPEEALAREALEEVGVPVLDVEYVGAQPWPFPHALMLGYRAHADVELGAVTVRDSQELADARWFTREQLREALAAGTVALPPKIAIGHHLIADWLARAG